MINKHWFPFLLFLLLSGLLVFSWFRFGYIYGGGDVGLQTYDPLRIVEIARYIWWEATAPGSPIPQGLTALPFNFVFSLLQKMGFTPVMLQASLFFLILFFMGLGMYYLILFIQGKEFKRYAVLGALFYMLNPYMMIQVWHRFVHSTFFLAASLPFLIIFWIKWIKTGKLLNLILFLFINLIALYLYGTIAFIVTVWLILFLITLGEGIFPWEGFKNFIKIAGKFLLGGFLWLLTNIWWFIPVFSVSPALFLEQHTSEGSLTTLINISRQAIIPYSLQMVNPFYLFLEQDFGSFYQSFLVRLIPWLFVSIILLGLIVGLKKKQIVNWSFIFIIILFLAKGASSPFGQAFIFGFENFFPLGVLRNPFEKIGILLPFVGAILFAQGFSTISNLVALRTSKKFVAIPYIFFLLMIFILHWPMFIPGIFGKLDKPAFVKVPDSYIQANVWIKNDLEGEQPKVLGKILHLPLTRGESISYKWEHGYGGIEPSALFFTSLPSIARGFNIKRVDDSLTALSLIFHKSNSQDSQKILKLLQDFNVKYIVLHKDTSWLGGDLYDPNVTEEILNNLPFFEIRETFDNLMIYKISDQYFRPKVTLESNVQLVYPSDKSNFWPYLVGNSQLMITPIDHEIDEKIFNMVSQVIIFPKSSYVYPKESFIQAGVNQAVNDESIARKLLSFFVDLKPILRQNGEIHSEVINEKLISVTEQIVSMVREQSSSGISPTDAKLTNYQRQIHQIFSNSLRNTRLLFYLNEKDIRVVFQLHLTALALLSEKASPPVKVKLNQIQDYLKEKLTQDNFIPKNPIDLDTDDLLETQKIFKFQIPKDLQYEILLIDTERRNDYPGKLDQLLLSINGKRNTFSTKDLGKILSLGNYAILNGDWEIVYNNLASQNLFLPFEKLVKFGNVTVSDDTIKIEPAGQIGYIESLIPNAKGGDVYRVNFEVSSQTAPGFHFQMVQDTDPVNQEGIRVGINQFIPLVNGTNLQNSSFVMLPLKPTTQDTVVRLGLASNGQLPPPTIFVKNFRIQKLLNNDLVLKGVLNESKDNEESGQILNIDRKNPTFYKGRVEIKKPSFLIFSETYHPGWKLKLRDGKNTILPQKHMMANLYGNAYFVENIGNFEFSLEFEPQRIVVWGVFVAALSYIGLLGLILWNKLKR